VTSNNDQNQIKSMNIKIKLSMNNPGQLSSAIHRQLRSRGGAIGERMAAMIETRIRHEIQRRIAAHRHPIRLTKYASPVTSAPAITMIAVQSSSLRRVGYSQGTSTLRIAFKNESLWDYLQVPLSTYRGLMQAPSKGKFFLANIKGRFPDRRIR
jgi:hypothetical protein